MNQGEYNICVYKMSNQGLICAITVFIQSLPIFVVFFFFFFSRITPLHIPFLLFILFYFILIQFTRPRLHRLIGSSNTFVLFEFRNIFHVKLFTIHNQFSIDFVKLIKFPLSIPDIQKKKKKY